MHVTNLTADATVFTANAYLVEGDRTVLVDTGVPDDVPDRIAAHVADIDALVLTHQHRDHIAALDAVCDRFDPDCYAFAPHPRRTHPLADGDRIQVGDEQYQVVHSPGHADDHVALIGSTVMFSGDVVVYTDEAFSDGSFGRTDRPGQSRDQLIASLRTIADRLPASVTDLYPGHGPSFHAAESDDTVGDIVRRALERAEERTPKYD